MILDLRYPEEFSGDLARRYRDVLEECRGAFVTMVEAISRDNLDNLDWFLSAPASRDVQTSPLFERCCQLEFIRRLTAEGIPISEIHTDSPALRRSLRPLTSGKETRIELHRSLWLSVLDRLRPLGHLLRLLCVHSIARLGPTGRLQELKEPITLIDTFLLPKMPWSDRYYSGMLEQLNDRETQDFYFAPTLYRIPMSSVNSCLSALQQTDRKWLIKEAYLRIADYFHSLGHVLRRRAIHLEGARFQGQDVVVIVQEELWSNGRLGATMVGLLNHQFFRRLKEAGVEIRLAVDWFENQVVDKGWNSGLKRFYPDTETVGYCGFISAAFNLYMKPIRSEMEAGLLPDRVAAVGPGLTETLKEHCPDLNVVVAPAFRFSHLHRPRQARPDPGRQTILVALPIGLAEAARIVELVSGPVRLLADPPRVVIKRHPTTELSRLKAACRSWEDSLEIREGPFEDALERCHLLISAASSTCVESLARGIPVIVIGNIRDLTCNPIPDSAPGELWELCFTEEELQAALERFLSQDEGQLERFEKLGNDVRESFFTPVTEGAVREFLSLPPEA